eukprot:TRINITY_DN50368_c0_g1_i1.p2 TRINITY_DN50368_c0_g1~~TRINITY_DN50368_c0_g1_i1.p2  ORF type:complete len:369 (+),score=228.72 TRINITY_DN50368_c0_g1_i1:75-1109(+)
MLEIEQATRTLIVAKNRKDEEVGFNSRECVLQHDQIVRLKLSNKLPNKLAMTFFPGDQHLIRKQKVWKFLFEDHGARERFYRHMQMIMVEVAITPSDYEPQPLVVSDDVHKIVSTLPCRKIAAKVHHQWLEMHLVRGWKWGAEIDEEKRTHPLMREFDKLDANAQEDELRVVSETLGAVIALGFDIAFDETAKVRRNSLWDDDGDNKNDDAGSGGGGSGSGSGSGSGESKDKKKERKHSDGDHLIRAHTNARMIVIGIPRELVQLVEYLAENAHEIWAENKKRRGWTFGETRSTKDKTHPDLIPYFALPEFEKEFDRSTARRVLSGLIDLGFRISKHSNAAQTH